MSHCLLSLVIVFFTTILYVLFLQNTVVNFLYHEFASRSVLLGDDGKGEGEGCCCCSIELKLPSGRYSQRPESSGLGFFTMVDDMDPTEKSEDRCQTLEFPE